MKAKFIVITSVLLTATVIFFVYNKKEHIKEITRNTLFQIVPQDSSHIHFTNIITTSDSLNFFTYEYMYNGGGVGIGDFNIDTMRLDPLRVVQQR